MLLPLLIAPLLLACSPRFDGPAVLLVSLDGLRADAIDHMPMLSAMANDGVRARQLIPPFPSKTYPSHMTLATGLHPEDHGIVSNDFLDPETGQEFTYGDADDLSDASWFGGEPIWVTAELQGATSAVMWFPGHQAPIQGVLPTVSAGIDHSWTHDERVDMAVGWLSGEGLDEPARLATLYLSDADDQGHWNGPGSQGLYGAELDLDATIGQLRTRLDEEGLDHVDLLVVSDHGMGSQDRDHVVFLDQLIDLDTVEIPSFNPVAHIWPQGDVTTLLADLAHAQGMACHAKADVPEHLFHRDNPRISPVVCIAEPGWAIGTTSAWEANETAYTGGMHGYDPTTPDMAAVLVGVGPGFAEGATVDQVHAVDVYGLVAALLDLDPAETSGDPDRWQRLLRKL